MVNKIIIFWPCRDLPKKGKNNAHANTLAQNAKSVELVQIFNQNVGVYLK